MIARLATMIFSLLTATAYADIQLNVAEFPPEQREQLSAIAEQVERTCSEVFGEDVASTVDSALIEVHLQYKDYERIDREMNSGAYRTNWSFVSPRSMQAHVALQPPLEYSVLVETGLPLQTKIRVANVAVYLCLYRAFENGASFPAWLRRGLSIQIGSMALRELGVMGDLEMEPWTSTEIHSIRRLFEDEPRFDIEAILENETEDIASGRIASVRGAFVGWLMELGVLGEVLGHAEQRSDEAQLRAATLAAIAGAGVEDADKAFRDWIDAFDPEWDEEVRSLTTRGDEWFHSAWDRRKAVCWNKQTLGSRDWEITGSVKVFDRDNAQMDVLFGYTEAGFMTVALSPEFGLKIFHCQLEDGDRDKDKWVRLETKELRTLEIGEWADFSISKRRNRLIVKINRERPIMLDVSDIDLDGNWGLGCQYRSAGMWRNVVVD